MIEYYKKVVFENYANFSGRARRSEYWYYQLAQFLIFILFAVLGVIVGSLFDNTLGGLIGGYIVFAVYSLVTLLPSLGVIVRRLHDTGKSGWFYFVSLIPFVGGIWILVVLCTEGNYGPNQYGNDPKNEVEEINQIGNVELQ